MKDIIKNQDVNRRQFIIRCAKAGLGIAAVCGVGYRFYDPLGPGASGSLSAGMGLEQIRIPDFSIPAQAGKMAVAHGKDRVTTVQQALKALGGIESFIRRGDVVLLKVNAAFASPPVLSATAHPDLVREVARLCFQAGAASVRVTDNPINDPASCFALSGIGAAAESAGADLYLPKSSYFRRITLDGGTLIRDWPFLHEPFQGVTKVIGISPVKDHHRSGASMSLKNWYGVLGGRRNVFHQDINNIIKELAMLIRPTLVILDGTAAMITNGPTGGSLSDLRPTETMIVSTDPVAADAFGATLLGKTALDFPYIQKAHEVGAGQADYTAIKLIRV